MVNLFFFIISLTLLFFSEIISFKKFLNLIKITQINASRNTHSIFYITIHTYLINRQGSLNTT